MQKGQGETVVIPLSAIRNFDANPRFVDNAAYDSLLSGLRSSRGLHVPLEVTRYPDDPTYVTYRGGGTRLQALQALYEATYEDCFNQVPIIERPFPGTAQLVINHLAENDHRGDLTFVERAVAVLDLKTTIEAAEGELSDTAFVERAEAMGYAIHRTRLPLYRFAVTTLYPYIPVALQAGMGRPQIARFALLYKALEAMSNACGGTARADTVWVDALVPLDSTHLTVEDAKNAMATELAGHCGLRVEELRHALDQHERGKGEPLVPPRAASPTEAPNTQQRRVASLRALPRRIQDCVAFSDDLSQFNVSLPEQPLDRTDPGHANACFAWHLARTLDPTCQPDDAAIERQVGVLSNALVTRLNHHALPPLLRHIALLHERLAQRDRETSA